MNESLQVLGYPEHQPFRRTTDMATLPEAFQRTVNSYPKAVALRTADDSVRLTWREAADQVERLAGSLTNLGMKRGDTIALLLTNRPEHQLMDLAALHLGTASTSVYSTLPPIDLAYNIGDSGSRIVITEPSLEAGLREAVTSHGLALDHVIVLDRDEVEALDGVEVHTYAELLDLPAPAGFDFERSWRAVSADDVATVIYTSGTTDLPKGVELQHSAVLHTVDTYHEAAPLETGRRLLSGMPMAHIGERIISYYLAVTQGHCVTFCPDLRQLNSMYLRVRPAMIFLVPRSLERFRSLIEAHIETQPDADRRKRLHRAGELGQQLTTANQEGTPLPDEKQREWEDLAEERSELLSVVGLDGVEYAVVGGAYVDINLLLYFLGLGLPIREGYGSTECCALATPGRLSDEYRIGYAGPVATGMELRIAEDGEILVRGPRLMRGYRNKPEATKKAIDADGWLHTGDIGVLNELGQLRMVDRKKDLIINTNGKNISPVRIESRVVLAGSLIGTAVATGDSREFVSALLVANPEGVASYRREHPELSEFSDDQLGEDPGFRAAVQEQVDAANRDLSAVEQIKAWTLIMRPWGWGGDEITASNKLKRRAVLAKYESTIDAMYH
ncbi:AMP-dependent synthetase/ligase [Streptomyces sp. NBC_01320]|uniref:AMP-dependent synthetase/ligase n=1 Tax=Streptomyces sp. NBC_01320 TaxID=2903824 RepID=UPI002E119EDA|nr:AMP-binding protein [Streptomyces sp. NBC_01320]